MGPLLICTGFMLLKIKFTMELSL